MSDLSPVRIPAAFNGIFSLKPTPERLSYRQVANTNAGQNTSLNRWLPQYLSRWTRACAALDIINKAVDQRPSCRANSLPGRRARFGSAAS